MSLFSVGTATRVGLVVAMTQRSHSYHGYGS